MRIAYQELTAAVSSALEQRGLTARVQLQPIDPPRPWGVTSSACFTLGAQHAAAEIEAATAGLDKKAAKDTAGKLAREAGIKLAQETAAELEQVRQAGGLTQYVCRVEAEGAYLNFYYDARALADLVIATTNLPDPTPENPLDDFGSGTVPKDQRKQIMVEYAQPNTHKDFHVGHLRNASIGQAIANLLEFSGHTVYKATYLGDVGAHVAKAIYGSRNIPRDASDALDYWGRAYKSAQDAPNEELVAWLNRWEAGDPEARAQWQTSRDECVAAFKAIFAELIVDFHPDCWFYESTVDDSHLGQKTAEELKQRGVAIVDETEQYKGALYVDFAAQADAVRSAPRENTETGQPGTAVPLEPADAAASKPQPVFSEAEKKRIKQLGKMTILRSNGTSLYQTKELGLAKYKFDWVKETTGRDLDESLYVVGAEQKLYFEQVFAILRLWGFPNADKCKHIAYELVVLPEGKMSSREGTVVSYRELRDAAVKQAEDVIREKGIITDEAQIRQTAHDVAIAAIKFTMLQVSGNQQIVFDFAQALSFDGRAAPYLQYAYARAGKLVADKSEVRGPESEVKMEQSGVRSTEYGDKTEDAAIVSPDSINSAAKRPLLLTNDTSSSATDSGLRTPDKQGALSAPGQVQSDLHPSEVFLARLLSQFPETCRTASEKYEPAVLCNYLYSIADAFSAFYRDCRVLGAPEPERSFRQGLTRAFRYVMQTGFNILALPLPEAM